VKALGLTTFLLAALCAPYSSLAQTAIAAPTDAEAADVARFVADRATLVKSNAPANDLEAAAQVHVSALAALASRLETEIRAGKSRRETRRLYEQLRARRVALIGLGMQGDIGVGATEIQVFEQMLEELSAYFRKR